jgi:hypothetical protein
VSPSRHGNARPIDDASAAVGIAIGAFGPLVVAALCIPIREDATTANLALLFVVIVVAAGAAGGRLAGAVAAVVSAMSFDFFLTRPYGSLKIDRAADFETAALLLVIGLLTSELVAFAYRNRAASARSHDEIHRLHEVADRVAAGARPEEISSTVRLELIDLLSLLDCRFEVPPFDTEFVRIDHDGTFAARRRRWGAGELALPEAGAQIPVVARGQTFGRFVLIPDPSAGVSLEARVVAVTLVDQLGAAFAADPGTAAPTRGSVR